MKASTSFFIALCAVTSAIAMVPTPAAAHGGDRDWGGHGWGGWGVGIGIGVLPGPYYYPPPPVYYAPPPPPPGYYAPYPGFIEQVPSQTAQQAPVQSNPAGAAQSCDAGDYTCPMEVTVPEGGRCYCPGNNGERVYGTAR
ncbi:MAG: hypothetical protein KGJ73_08755 [Rhodospirillales bacterium]|nr:hypothetical protein [Rhodospirillales bacterium]